MSATAPSTAAAITKVRAGFFSIVRVVESPPARLRYIEIRIDFPSSVSIIPDRWTKRCSVE
jgi:hypothetical protein